MGEVLSMKCENSKWRLAAFILNKVKKNYKIYDREILVIIRYLKK